MQLKDGEWLVKLPPLRFALPLDERVSVKKKLQKEIDNPRCLFHSY